MKKQKIITLLLFAFVTFGLSAQNKEKAKKIASEMTNVLELNKNESKAIYKIQLNKFKESDEINETYQNQPEIKKQKLKLLGNKVYNEIKETIGIERLKKWKNYKQKK